MPLAGLRSPFPPRCNRSSKGDGPIEFEDPIETSVSALKELAQQIRTASRFFAQYGRKRFSPPEARTREQEIVALAAEFEKLAAEMEQLAAAPQQPLPFHRVTEIVQKLHKLGFYPNNLLFENVVRAFVSAEKFRRSEQSAFNGEEDHG